MRCPRCQSQNREGATFCEDCGARLELACPNCGEALTPGKKFCASCGTPVTPPPAYLLDGRLADATRIAQDGLVAARQRGEPGVEGQLLRLLGDIAAHPDRFEVDTAAAHYRQALALAEALGLRPLLAHCHRGLGELYRRAGKRQEAREHLTTARTMFGEMDMWYWREQQEMAMAELA